MSCEIPGGRTKLALVLDSYDVLWENSLSFAATASFNSLSGTPLYRLDNDGMAFASEDVFSVISHLWLDNEAERSSFGRFVQFSFQLKMLGASTRTLGNTMIIIARASMREDNIAKQS